MSNGLLEVLGCPLIALSACDGSLPTWKVFEPTAEPSGSKRAFDLEFGVGKREFGDPTRALEGKREFGDPMRAFDDKRSFLEEPARASDARRAFEGKRACGSSARRLDKGRPFVAESPRMLLVGVPVVTMSACGCGDSRRETVGEPDTPNMSLFMVILESVMAAQKSGGGRGDISILVSSRRGGGGGGGKNAGF